MRAKKLRAKNDSFLRFAECLRAGESFETHEALRGVAGSTLTSSFGGRLPGEYSTPPGQTVDYVVYSYGTPIAWRLSDTGKWIVPNVSYSRTTSCHQGTIRAAVSQLAARGDDNIKQTTLEES